jgi:hypothetical protein
VDWQKFIGDLLKYAIVIAPVILSAILGYIFAKFKSFREEKQKAYSELLPIIVKMLYDPQPTIESEFSRSLMKLWLYANKRVAKKLDNAIGLFHKQDRRDEVTKALQEAIVEMRRDIQIWPWQRLKPDDVRHLYTKIVK